VSDTVLKAFMRSAKAVVSVVLKNSDSGEHAAHTFKRRIRRNVCAKIDRLLRNPMYEKRFGYNKKSFTTKNLVPGLVHGDMIIVDYRDGGGKRGGILIIFRKSYGNPHKILVDYFTNEDERTKIKKRFNEGKIVPDYKPAWFNNQRTRQ